MAVNRVANITKRIHVVTLGMLLLSLSFTIPHINHTGLFVILLSASALVSVFFIKPRNVPLKITLVFCAIYLVCIIGFFMSDNRSGAAFVLEKKLSLLLFPLIFAFGPRLKRSELWMLINSFILGCVLTAIYCLAVGVYHLVEFDDSAYLFYRIMSSTVGMHPVYLSMYYCTACAFIFYQLANMSLKKYLVPIAVIVLLLLSASVVLLSGRLPALVLMAGYFVFAWTLIKRRYGSWRAFAGGLLFAVVVFMIFLVPARNRGRIMDVINVNKKQNVDAGKATGASVRPFIWECAVSLIDENAALGVGIGDSQARLTECYAERNYNFLLDANGMKFNAHNQYLEQGVSLGFAGIMVLLISWFYPVRLALRKNNYLYLIFISIFAACCITESLLERQSGIVFFAVFNSLLYFEDSGYNGV